MHVCFITDFYPTVDVTAGIGSYTRSMAQALAARGHQVHVLLGRCAQPYDAQDGLVQVHVRWVRWLPFVSRWLPSLGESVCFAWALFRLHRKYRFDVVEFPNWEGMGLISALLGFVPIVVRVHSSTVEELSTSQRIPTRAERFCLWAEKTSARLALAVATRSQTPVLI